MRIGERSTSRRVSNFRRSPNKRFNLPLCGTILVGVVLVYYGWWKYQWNGPLVVHVQHQQTPIHSCRYHGNCPAGTACDPSGFCYPYFSNQTSNTWQHGLCVQQCLQELRIEEEFQYGSIPVVQFTSVAAPPHSGCVIQFQRQRRTSGPAQRPSQDIRIAQRWRSVIRIDYVGQENVWMVMCRLPCKRNNDCPRGLTCQGRPGETIQNRGGATTCQPPKPPVSDMIVVSGCDDTYFSGLQNFAASLHYWAPHRKLVIYNLGMTTDQLSEIKDWPNLLAIRWPHGIPSSFPPHVSNDLKNYAWKSLVINDTVHEFKSIFWMDAGATFVGSIDPIEEIIQLHGIFLVKGQDDHMKYLSHPGT